MLPAARSTFFSIASERMRQRLSQPVRKVFTGLLLFLFVCGVAVAGYVAAGWSLRDAVYMVIITIFGVGYGEVQPVQSDLLRGLTITVIIGGHAAVLYVIGGVMQMLINGELNSVLGARRMTREIDQLTSHTIICGIGRLGSILAAELYAAGKPFVAIDTDEHRLQVAEQHGYLVLNGDATDEETLDAAGIERAATVATVLSDDALNVFVTITARSLNMEATIIARAENPRTEKKLIGSGANKVVLPTAIGATKVAHMIIRPTTEDMLDEVCRTRGDDGDLSLIGLHFDELPVMTGSPLVDHKISEIEINSNHGFLIVGIRSAGGRNQLNPDPSTTLVAGDVVVVLGHANDIPELVRRFAAPEKRMVYRGVST